MQQNKLGFFARLLANYLMQEVDRPSAPLSSYDMLCQEVRPADIILVAGRNRVSRIIRKVTQSPWTHAALYIGKLYDIEDAELRQKISQNKNITPSDPLIIESLAGKGTVINLFSNYKKEHIRICRPRGIAHSDAISVTEFALRHLGHSYNMRHFFDLGRFLLNSIFFPSHLGSSLFTKDPDNSASEICSTMIANAYRSIDFPILPKIVYETKTKYGFKLRHRNPKLFTPSDFDYSPYFDIIKYPMLSPDSSSYFKDLPWIKGNKNHENNKL